MLMGRTHMKFRGYVNGKDRYVTRLILSTTGQQVSLDNFDDKNKALQDMAEIVDKIESIPVDTGRSKVAETPTQKDKRLRGALLTDLIKQHSDLVESYTNDSGECTPLDL